MQEAEGKGETVGSGGRRRSRDQLRRGRERWWVVGGGGRWRSRDQLREYRGQAGRGLHAGFKQSLSPNEFLLGYLHSKQEKEDQLWAEGARAHCKQWGLKGEGSPSEKR